MARSIGIALGVAIVTTVAVSRSANYLAANEGANPLVVPTEGFQSAFVACVVLAWIGVALGLLLLGVRGPFRRSGSSSTCWQHDAHRQFRGWTR